MDRRELLGLGVSMGALAATRTALADVDGKGPRTFHAPDDWSQFIGHYRNEDPWFGSVSSL